MTMKIITGYTGTKHITPADDAGLHKGIFGEGDFVLPSGSQLAATIQSATEVRIADGELVMQGRHARNDSGYQAMAIANGTQGMNRNDLIVARYTKNASTSVESISLVVITGTASSGTASDPAYNTGNIENGETRDFPLYRVKLNGITIGSIEKLWESPVLPVERGGTGVKTVAKIKELLGLAKAAFVDLVTVALGGTGKSSHTSNAVLTGNGTNPVNNVATASGAFYATGTNSAAKFGTLPIAQGGTGSTTAAGALSNLGVTATATELNYMDGVTSNVQSQLNNKANSSHTHSYLPLSGGTVNGGITANGFTTGGAISANSLTTESTLTCKGNCNVGTSSGGTGLNLYHKTTPFIDFHYGGASNYTSRIIEVGQGELSINGTAAGKGGLLSTKTLYVTDEPINNEPARKTTADQEANLYVTTSGTFCRASGNSSRTLKHDIKELSNDDLKAENLYDLNVVQFKYNDGVITKENNSRHGKDLVGFIIEDLEEVYPIAVDKPNDDVKEWSWNTRYLIPPMLKLIQELHKEVEELKAKVQ